MHSENLQGENILAYHTKITVPKSKILNIQLTLYSFSAHWSTELIDTQDIPNYPQHSPCDNTIQVTKPTQLLLYHSTKPTNCKPLNLTITEDRNPTSNEDLDIDTIQQHWTAEYNYAEILLNDKPLQTQVGTKKENNCKIIKIIGKIRQQPSLHLQMCTIQYCTNL